MDLLMVVRIASVLVVALVYMIYDVYNKRVLPDWFAYSTLFYGLLLTLLLIHPYSILESLLIAGGIFCIGYLVYRLGQLGLGDVIEFVAISLMLPFQQTPILVNVLQYNFPFLLSIIIASGMAAFVLVPLYYIPKAVKLSKKSILNDVRPKEFTKSMLIGLSYVVLIAALSIVGVINIYGIILFAIFTFGSVFSAMFETPMAKAIIVMANADSLSPSDMVAFSLLSKPEKSKLSSEIKSFSRVVTKEMITEMKKKDIKTKLPVYKEGIPFAIPIFIGIVISILLGNLFILVIH